MLPGNVPLKMGLIFPGWISEGLISKVELVLILIDKAAFLHRLIPWSKPSNSWSRPTVLALKSFQE